MDFSTSSPSSSFSDDHSDSGAGFCTPCNDKFYQRGVYRPLSVEREEIRLVKLLPGVDHDEIECNLEQNVPLQQQQYAAISYCAGSPYDTEKIRLDGTPFRAFASVGRALRRIRDQHLVIFLWVDQMCINQSDIDERGRQVSLMSKIYSHASRTYAWLGEDTEYRHEALTSSFATDVRQRILHDLSEDKSLAALNELLAVAHEQPPEEKSLIMLRNTPEGDELNEAMIRKAVKIATDLAEGGEHKVNDFKLVKSLEHMSNSPWWTRCWIYQEAILSNNLIMCYGTQKCAAWDMWCTALVISAAHLGDSPYSMRPPEEMHTLAALDNSAMYALLRMRYVGFGKARSSVEKIRNVLFTSRGLNSGDPRDKIFGVLGLFNNEINIVPNYQPENTVTILMKRLAKSLIHHEGNLNVIGDSAGHHKNKYRGLPSWVPDYSKESPHQTLTNNRKIPFAASSLVLVESRSPRWVRVPPHFDGGFRHLRGPGDLLECTLVDLGDVGEFHPKFRKDCGNPNDRKTYYPTRQDMDKALWQTLLFGQDDNAVPELLRRDNTIFNSAWYERDESQHLRWEIYKTGYLTSKLYPAWGWIATRSGVLGRIPACARPQDRVCIIMGADLPFICTKSWDAEDQYEIVGPCYLHGFMHGEAVADFLGDNVWWPDARLVQGARLA